MDMIDRMVEVREDHDDTQRSLGTALGIAQAQLARYENRKHELPIRYLVAFCQHYGVSADYLLGLPRDLAWPR